MHRQRSAAPKDMQMASERVYMVDGREMVPVQEVRAAAPIPRYYVQRDQLYTVAVDTQPRVLVVRPGYQVIQVHEPLYERCRPSIDGGGVIAAILAVEILIFLGLATIFLLYLLANSRLW